MFRKILLSILCVLATVPAAFAKYESGSLDAQSVVAYGQGPSGIVPLMVDADGAVYISGGGSSQWDETGSDIYYTGGNVGIGVADPQSALDVAGDIVLDGALYVGDGVYSGGSAETLTGTTTRIDLKEDTGVIALRSFGNSNNESLTINAESAADKIIFGSDSGVTAYQFPDTLQVSKVYAGGVGTGSTWNVDSALVSFYKMENNAGNTTVTDSKGSNTGTASVNTSNLSEAGKINLGFNLYSNNNEYISLGADASMKDADDFAIAFWVKTTQAVTARIGGDRALNAPSAGVELILVSGQIRLLGDVGDTSAQTQSSTVINTGDWFFVVAQYNTAQLEVYVNGVLEDSDPLSGNLGLSPSNWQLGRTPINATYFGGTLDNFQYFNRDLTLAEIQALYAEGVGTDSVSGGGTDLTAQVIASSASVASTHGLNSLGSLYVENSLEVDGTVYFDGPIYDASLYGSSAGVGAGKQLWISADGRIYAP